LVDNLDARDGEGGCTVVRSQGWKIVVYFEDSICASGSRASAEQNSSKFKTTNPSRLCYQYW